MLSHHRQHRMQSSLQLFLEACRLWGQTFENDELLCRIEAMGEELQQMELSECSEELVKQVEEATVQLVDSMDNLFKALGGQGFCHGRFKH